MWGTKAKAAGNSGTLANAVRQLHGVAAALVALLVLQCNGAVAQAADIHPSWDAMAACRRAIL